MCTAGQRVSLTITGPKPSFFFFFSFHFLINSPYRDCFFQIFSFSQSLFFSRTGTGIPTQQLKFIGQIGLYFRDGSWEWFSRTSKNSKKLSIFFKISASRTKFKNRLGTPETNPIPISVKNRAI